LSSTRPSSVDIPGADDDTVAGDDDARIAGDDDDDDDDDNASTNGNNAKDEDPLVSGRIVAYALSVACVSFVLMVAGNRVLKKRKDHRKAKQRLTAPFSGGGFNLTQAYANPNFTSGHDSLTSLPLISAHEVAALLHEQTSEHYHANASLDIARMPQPMQSTMPLLFQAQPVTAPLSGGGFNSTQVYANPNFTSGHDSSPLISAHEVGSMLREHKSEPYHADASLEIARMPQQMQSTMPFMFQVQPQVQVQVQQQLQEMPADASLEIARMPQQMQSTMPLMFQVQPQVQVQQQPQEMPRPMQSAWPPSPPLQQELETKFTGTLQDDPKSLLDAAHRYLSQQPKFNHNLYPSFSLPSGDDGSSYCSDRFSSGSYSDTETSASFTMGSGSNALYGASVHDRANGFDQMVPPALSVYSSDGTFSSGSSDRDIISSGSSDSSDRMPSSRESSTSPIMGSSSYYLPATVPRNVSTLQVPVTHQRKVTKPRSHKRVKPGGKPLGAAVYATSTTVTLEKLKDAKFCASLRAKDIKAGFAGTYTFVEWALMLNARGRNRVAEVLELSAEDRALLVKEAKRYKHNRWQSNYRIRNQPGKGIDTTQ